MIISKLNTLIIRRDQPTLVYAVVYDLAYQYDPSINVTFARNMMDGEAEQLRRKLKLEYDVSGYVMAYKGDSAIRFLFDAKERLVGAHMEPKKEHINIRYNKFKRHADKLLTTIT